MNSEKLVLGIDLGTTSIKICIVDIKSLKIIYENSKETKASVESSIGSLGNEQNVKIIQNVLNELISNINIDFLQKIGFIGICGQMHGIVFWNWKENELVSSNLYTWQDGRCSKEFLEKLPKPDSHLKVNSGYGVATTFWLIKNKPEALSDYKYSGTIQDFIVFILCSKSLMSIQNAASWGYFNTERKSWNFDILKKSNFPINILPTVVESGQIAGITNIEWNGIPKGTQIGVALGDFQCSFYSTLRNAENGALLNISTSAQLAFISQVQNLNSKGSHVEYFPYFSGKYLTTAASLNGGNVLATFVKTIQEWFHEISPEFSIDKDKIWNRILQSGNSETAKTSANPLIVKPTVYGERHSGEKCSISNINLENLRLGNFVRAICTGIIANFHEMMPKSLLTDQNIQNVIGTGTALCKNKILQEEFEKIYGLPLVLSESDAAYGAALAMIDMNMN